MKGKDVMRKMFCLGRKEQESGATSEILRDDESIKDQPFHESILRLEGSKRSDDTLNRSCWCGISYEDLIKTVQQPIQPDDHEVCDSHSRASQRSISSLVQFTQANDQHNQMLHGSEAVMARSSSDQCEGEAREHEPSCPLIKRHDSLLRMQILPDEGSNKENGMNDAHLKVMILPLEGDTLKHLGKRACKCESGQPAPGDPDLPDVKQEHQLQHQSDKQPKHLGLVIRCNNCTKLFIATTTEQAAGGAGNSDYVDDKAGDLAFVRTQQYTCPECQGNIFSPDQGSANQPLFNVVKKSRDEKDGENERVYIPLKKMLRHHNKEL